MPFIEHDYFTEYINQNNEYQLRSFLYPKLDYTLILNEFRPNITNKTKFYYLFKGFLNQNIKYLKYANNKFSYYQLFELYFIKRKYYKKSLYYFNKSFNEKYFYYLFPKIIYYLKLRYILDNNDKKFILKNKIKLILFIFKKI